MAAGIIGEWEAAHPDEDDGKPMPVAPAGTEPDRALNKEEPVKRGPGRPKKVHP